MKKAIGFLITLILIAALTQSGCAVKSKKSVDFIETDVVVVGGGAAGLMATVKLSEYGANVILMEKMPYLGGNTIISAGILQAAGTSVQRKFGVEGDSPENFIEDLKYIDRDYADQQFIYSKIMHEEGRNMVEKLNNNGLEFVGLAYNRMHIMYPELYRGGATLIEFLKDMVVHDNAKILVNTEVVRLIEKNGRIVGVKANRQGEIIKVKSKAVILATGGFSSNPEMIEKYLPELSALNSRASKGITGDGIIMAQEHGAGVVAMDAGQHMFYVNPDRDIDVPLLLGLSPAIIVNAEGKRFVNEAIDYAEVARAAVGQPEQRGYIIFDEMVRKGHEPIEKYFEVGIVKEANSIKDLAEKIKLPQLVNTVSRYNEMAEAGFDEDFNREHNLVPLKEPKFYAINVEPMIYNSYGGLKIDEKCRVLETDGSVIKGLYAAGEVTGSVEVQEGLKYTSGIIQALVFGERAAETAFSEMK